MISKLKTFSLYVTQKKQMICCRVYIQYYKMFREMCNGQNEFIIFP